MTERQKEDNPFRNAIPYLGRWVDKRHPHRRLICQALGRARLTAEACKRDPAPYWTAERHVMSMLRDSTDVEEWLVKRGCIRYHGSKPEEVRQYRLAWLNHMADQWDKGEIC